MLRRPHRAPGRRTREGTPVSGGLILSVESSCDETGIALIEDGRLIRANVVASQVGNVAHPQWPGLEDFGDVMLHGNGVDRKSVV